MEFEFQFGVVGVGFGGGKAHFVIAQVGESEFRHGREYKKYFDVNVYCGSQKFSQRGYSGISGFVPVGEVHVGRGVAPEWAVKEGENYAQRIAAIAAKSEVYADYQQQEFEAAVEKYGENFCAKCKKQNEQAIAWKAKKESEIKEGK